MNDIWQLGTIWISSPYWEISERYLKRLALGTRTFRLIISNSWTNRVDFMYRVLINTLLKVLSNVYMCSRNLEEEPVYFVKYILIFSGLNQYRKSVAWLMLGRIVSGIFYTKINNWETGVNKTCNNFLFTNCTVYFEEIGRDQGMPGFRDHFNLWSYYIQSSSNT